jgi:hypothetical protein
MTDKEGALRRVYVQLKVMSDNPPPEPDEVDAIQFNELVHQLSALGYDVDDFSIRDRDFVSELSGWNTATQELIYDGPRTVRPDIIKNKVDALLLFFELGVKETPITFNAPHRS